MNHLHSIASSEPGQDREVAALSFLVMWVEMVDRRFSIQKKENCAVFLFFFIGDKVEGDTIFNVFDSISKMMLF